MLGIDLGFLSPSFVHLIILKEDLFLVENLANLGRLPAIGATVYILPIKIKGALEAPVRAVAVLA